MSHRAAVTGGARGIGRAIVERLIADGHRVAVLDRDGDELDRVAGALAVEAVTVDLADPEAARGAVAEAATRLGGLDVLVNNAGVFSSVPLLELQVEEWDRMFAVNARAMLCTIQAAVPHLVAAGGGRIVNMASMGGKEGEPGQAHYAASKAAVIALTRVAAMELGPHGITVNCICPGYVLTDLAADGRDEAQVRAWATRSPLGRLGTPADVAGQVAFLVSPDAAYVTGQALNVTGGMIMH